MSYRISPRADRDIRSICDDIARDNVSAADKLDRRLHEAIERLGSMPGLGHGRADVRNPRYRFWSVGNYVVAYRMEGRVLVVVRVVHGARNFRKLFRGR